MIDASTQDPLGQLPSANRKGGERLSRTALALGSLAVFSLIGVAAMQAIAIKADRETLVAAHREQTETLGHLSVARTQIQHLEDETTRLAHEWEGAQGREREALASRDKTQVELDQTKKRLYVALVELDKAKREFAEAQGAAKQDKATIAALQATIQKKEGEIAGLSAEVLSGDNKPIGDLFGHFLDGIQRPPSAAGYVAEQKCAMGGKGPGCEPTPAPAASSGQVAVPSNVAPPAPAGATIPAVRAVPK